MLSNRTAAVKARSQLAHKTKKFTELRQSDGCFD
jgi:hypothetical protein